MMTNAVAAQMPVRSSAGQRCVLTRSLRDTASLAAVVMKRMTNATPPPDSAMNVARMRVHMASASPAAKPAGNHATATRRSGCPPVPASSSSGRAPVIEGPDASTRASRNRYSQPTPAHTAISTSTQPRRTT